jgi:hypothetical protein
MVQDLVHNLCESLVENIDGVAGVGKKTPPTPITYLTQWKIMGNSEVHGNEIWSCGEYNPTDGKYHILVQPLGGSVADITLTEPLRKVNDVADTIEFPSNTEGKALVTRPFASENMGDMTWTLSGTNKSSKYRMKTLSLQNDIKVVANNGIIANILCPIINARNANSTYSAIEGISVDINGLLEVYDEDYNQTTSMTAFTEYVDGVELIYELATPTTELVDAPQIQEAESYSMVISQGGKAVEWSSFETE